MGHHHCCSKQKVKRGLWSPEEDEKLIKHITTHGQTCWSSVPKLAGLQRCGKSCRLRWINYLRPDLKRGSFTEQEERIIIDVHRILGNRWAQIAKHLPGRTDNEVKNFWNSCIKKKLIAQGLDPNTHNLLSSHHTINNNNNNINATNLSHQQATSAFSVTSSLTKDASIGMKTPFLNTLPHFPSSDHNSSLIIPDHVTLHANSINTIFECQNLNFSSQMELTTQSSVENNITTVPMSSSLSTVNNIPSGFGMLDENCMWTDTNFQPFKTIQEEILQLQQPELEKICEGEVDGSKTNELISYGDQNMDSFGSSNFDFEFVESALNYASWNVY